MVRLILIFFISLCSLNLNSEELSNNEEKIFEFIDLNKDQSISLEEINKSIKLIFQLIDANSDLSISKEEIIELKDMIDLLL